MKIVHFSAGALLVYLCGCSDDFSRDADVSSRPEQSDELGRLEIELNAGDETLFFEAVRHEHAGRNGQERPFEISARLYDVSGGTVALVAEGDDVPEDWQETTLLPAPKLRTLEILYERSQQSGLYSRERAPEMALLKRMLGTLREELERGVPADIVSATVQDVEGTAFIRKELPVYYQTRVDLWSQDAVFSGVPYDHTGTNTVRYKRVGDGPWQYDTTYTRCNHGTCPGEGRMIKYATCRGPSPSTYYRSPQKCRGYWGIDHLCNNDTLMQIFNTKYNSHHGTRSYDEICDSGLLFHRPWCSDI